MARFFNIIISLTFFCSIFASTCFAKNFEEVSFFFSPSVQFEFSERGVKKTFYREGNTAFSAFKAVGSFKDRTFKGQGIGKIKDGKVDYGCAIEMTLDETLSLIEEFKIEVNTRKVLNKERYDLTSVNYIIQGRDMPLSHISNYTDHDTLFFALKGPLSKKNITRLEVKYNTNTHRQVAKDKWKPEKYWRRSVDFKFAHSDGVFISLKGKVNESLHFNTETEKIYDIEKSAKGRTAEPLLKFSLSMVDRKKMDAAPSSLALTFKAKASVESPYYGTDKKVSDISINPLLKPKWYKWKSDMSLEFNIPLYEVLKQIYKEKGVYEYLTERQFNPDNPTDIPEETTLLLSLDLKEAKYRSKSNKKFRKINLGKTVSFDKRYILGAEIDLAKETRLKTGKGHSMDWHDLSGVVLAAAKAMTGYDKLQAAYTITDCIIQTHGGYKAAKSGALEGAAESAGSVAGAAIGFEKSLTEASDALGLIFLIPQLKRLVYDEFWGTPALIRSVEEGMRKLGYSPLSEARATKNFPIWFNPKEKRLALIDPAGMVHPVKPPKNFHVSWGFFRLQETEPAGKSLLFKISTSRGWSKWWTLGGPLVKNHKVLPPLRRHEPLRMKLPTPAGYTGKQRQKGFGTVRSVTFSHSKDSKLILERGDYYDGIVDFGWEDVSNPLVFEKPYLTLVSGRLRVKDEKSRIGIGFYKWKGDALEQYRPRLWCEPHGTEYVIDLWPETETCSVEVIEGQVNIRNEEGRIIDKIPQGTKKSYHVVMDDYLAEEFQTEKIETEKPKTKIRRKPRQEPSAVKEDAPSAAKHTNYLGVILPATSERLVVVNTFPESPARNAGMRMGDIIIALDGRDLSALSRKELIKFILSADPKKPLTFKIKRDGKILTIPVYPKSVGQKAIASSHARQKKEAQDYFEKAEAKKKQRRYTQAEPLYAKVVSLDPKRSAAYDYQAYCLDKSGRRAQGYRLLEMSLLLRDKMYNNYLYGKFLSLDKKYGRALPFLEKACSRVKKSGTYYFPFRELGGARFMLDDYKGASQALLTAEKMGDSIPLTIGTLGVCFDKLGERKKAIHYYRKYLSMNDSNRNMKQMARARLKKLEKKSTSGTNKRLNESVSTILDTILKEMQK